MNPNTKAANGEWYRYVSGSGSADQDMSEDKGMNMTEGSTRMLTTISANSARERNNNNHEPELRRKNEMERNYFTGSTTDDNLVLLRSDQFGFVRGRRISSSGNGPMPGCGRRWK